jgi:hypothetical protein
MRSHRQIALVAAGLVIIAAGAVGAQDSGWGSGYQMGQSYAGVSNIDKTRLTFSCAGRNARVDPGKGGPSLTVAMPKAKAMQAQARSVEIVVDDKATRVPVRAEHDNDMLAFVWTPGSSFGTASMRPVVAALRKAKTIEVRAAGATLVFSAQSADEALKDDPLTCD